MGQPGWARRLACLLLPLVITVAAAPAAAAPCASRPRVPVIVYHRIAPSASELEHASDVTYAQFASQIRWLSERGFSTLSQTELALFLAGEWSPQPPCVLIMFDDGYESVYSLAYPVLKGYSFRFSVALIGDMIWDEGHHREAYLSPSQVSEMVESGLVDVLNHTCFGHEAAGRWSKDEALRDFRRFDERVAAAQVPKPFAFVYPHGIITPSLKQAIREYGFAFAFGLGKGFITRRSDHFALPRFVVYPRSWEYLFSRIIYRRY